MDLTKKSLKGQNDNLEGWRGLPHSLPLLYLPSLLPCLPPSSPPCLYPIFLPLQPSQRSKMRFGGAGGGWLQGFSILCFVGRFVKLTNLIFGIFVDFVQKKPKSLFRASSLPPLPLPPSSFPPSLSPSAQLDFWLFGAFAKCKLVFWDFCQFGQVARKVKEPIWRGWGKGGGVLVAALLLLAPPLPPGSNLIFGFLAHSSNRFFFLGLCPKPSRKAKRLV